jgi:hypothetical protein
VPVSPATRSPAVESAVDSNLEALPFEIGDAVDLFTKIDPGRQRRWRKAPVAG